MTDPRGMAGAFLPMSVAKEQDRAACRKARRRSLVHAARPCRFAEDPIGAYWNRPSALPLTEAGRKAIEGFDGASTDNPRLRCEPTNILFDWAFETDVNRIEQSADMITLRYGADGPRANRASHHALSTLVASHPAAAAIPSDGGRATRSW